MNFGDNLRNLRKAKNMSQEQLAEKVNVSRQSVSKWENGEAYPEMKNIMLLCDIFGCKINQLVNDDITDSDSLDNEVQQVVIKFKQEQQRTMKILSKTTYIMARIAKILFKIIAVTLCLALISAPYILKNTTITDNTITLLDQEIEYSIEDSNILVLNGQKNFINTSTDLKEFAKNHSRIFYIVSIEYIIICLLAQVVCIIFLLINVEKIYMNIYNGDTPFTLENVKYMKKIALFLSLQILIPKISATIYSIIVRLDLSVEYNFTDIVVILIVISLTYIFKYGYEIQLDSKGKIYGNIEE